MKNRNRTEKQSEIITVSMSKQLAAKARRIAGNAELGLSAFIRQLIIKEAADQK